MTGTVHLSQQVYLKLSEDKSKKTMTQIAETRERERERGRRRDGTQAAGQRRSTSDGGPAPEHTHTADSAPHAGQKAVSAGSRDAHRVRISSYSPFILPLRRVYSVRASLTPALKQLITWPLPNFGSTGYFTSEDNCNHALKMTSGLAGARVTSRPDPRRVA